MKDLNGIEHKKQIVKELINFIIWLENTTNSYIVEGIDIIYLIPVIPKYYNYPIIVKKTSLIRSMIRKMIRDKHGFDNFVFMKNLIHW